MRLKSWNRVPAPRTLLVGLMMLLTCVVHGAPKLWVTSPDRNFLLSEIPGGAVTSPEVLPEVPAIVVDQGRTFQTVDGFGFALTGGSAQHLMLMAPEKRAALLKELFSRDVGGLGLSYLRVSVGASDLNQRVFSYDDLPAGQTDLSLAHFTLADDVFDVIPVLKEILTIVPDIKILASPWSAPVWMKTNQQSQGGKLREEYYPVYAAYLQRYVAEMAKKGIRIDALTLQNEPFNDGNTPSMQMFAKEQARFIRDFVGPLFERTGTKTKIIVYDHNCDAPEYPLSILNDPEASRFVDGSAFHLYAGDIAALSQVHDAFPEKNVYFSEMMVTNRDSRFQPAPPTARIVIGALRNWSRNVILWNLAADPDFKPHTDNGGCAMCQGAITLAGDEVTRNLAYYVLGHVSKFVPPASTRISSTVLPDVPTVAFVTPEGKRVLLVANTSETDKPLQVISEGGTVRFTVNAGAIATLEW